MDFSELKTAVADWSARTDLTTFIASSVELTTAMFNHGFGEDVKALRTRQMLASTDITPSSGAYALPADYLEYQRVVEKSSPRRELRYISPNQADQVYPFQEAGLSENFTIIGSNLYTFPVSASDVELTYYQAIPDLSDAEPSNWLLAKQPNLYLHGCLFQVYMYIQDEVNAQRSAALVTALTDGLNGTDAMSLYRGAGSVARGVKP